MRQIIGLAGRAGCGKSTAAAELVRLGFTRVRFAGPLKDMMRALGLTDEEIEGRFKESPCALLCGRTPRYAMQTIGTDWGRDMIGPRLWVNAWETCVHRLPSHIPVVCDDVRFQNEADAVHRMGGVVIEIKRAAVDAKAVLHPSEALQFDSDYVLDNNGTVEAFHDSLRMMLTGLQATEAA